MWQTVGRGLAGLEIAIQLGAGVVTFHRGGMIWRGRCGMRRRFDGAGRCRMFFGM